MTLASTATPNPTASHPAPMDRSRTKTDDAPCVPMARQNSGSHGYEMYPQQFVRLVGCHDAAAPDPRKRSEAKLH